MNENTKKYILGLLLIVAVVGLFAWGRMGQEANARTWADTAIRCLPNGHENLGQHIHPNITIVINGEKIDLDDSIGRDIRCMSEIHTHDSSGEVHIESVDALRKFTLGEFFAVWGREFDQNQIFEHMAGVESRLTMTVNGEESMEYENYVMRDHDQIVITYGDSAEETETVE